MQNSASTTETHIKTRESSQSDIPSGTLEDISTMLLREDMRQTNPTIRKKMGLPKNISDEGQNNSTRRTNRKGKPQDSNQSPGASFGGSNKARFPEILYSLHPSISQKKEPKQQSTFHQRKTQQQSMGSLKMQPFFKKISNLQKR